MIINDILLLKEHEACELARYETGSWVKLVTFAPLNRIDGHIIIITKQNLKAFDA